MSTQPPHDGDEDGRADTQDALALAEEAEADAEAALAEARATAARARAQRLRRQAEADTGAPAPVDDPESADVPAPKQRSTRRFRGKSIVVGAATVLLCALLGLSGFMAWQDRATDQSWQREAEAAAVARQGVVNIMSLDFTNAEGDIQRVLDSATGKFKEDFQAESEFLVQALEESQVVTEVTVNGVAVESLSDDAAVVLVSANSQASNAGDDRRDPQQFRVAVTLARDSGALKLSQVDFL
ncbi:hypothetical protein BH10ACT9_BH10ACT9_21170 [soil metagenome]